LNDISPRQAEDKSFPILPTAYKNLLFSKSVGLSTLGSRTVSAAYFSLPDQINLPLPNTDQ
jgi:hypothetical protein